MKQEELTKILDLHKLWLDNDPNGFRADLTSANLTSANLTSANLSCANLTNADLRGVNLSCADLTGTNLDFATFPLWCGTLDIKCDQRLFAQLAYHMCRLQVPDELKQYQEALKPIAKKFHRYGECKEL